MQPRATALAALILVAIAGCATTGQVRRLEARLAALEAAERSRAVDDTAAQLELEGKLVAMRLELDRMATRAADAAALAERLDRLERAGVAAGRPRPARPGPDPALVYAVPVAGLPSLGSDQALVTLVRAGEYACPFCEKVRPTIDELRRRYGPKLRVVNISLVVHPHMATLPAQAACAAHRQGRYWEMDELLWEKAFKLRQWEQANLEALARELGLDHARFVTDLTGDCVRAVQQQQLTINSFGVNATPGFFINGRFLSGAQPVNAFQALIDEELARAEQRLKGRRKSKRTYYDEFVLDQGLPRLASPPAAP